MSESESVAAAEQLHNVVCSLWWSINNFLLALLWSFRYDMSCLPLTPFLTLPPASRQTEIFITAQNSLGTTSVLTDGACVKPNRWRTDVFPLCLFLIFIFSSDCYLSFKPLSPFQASLSACITVKNNSSWVVLQLNCALSYLTSVMGDHMLGQTQRKHCWIGLLSLLIV